MKKESLENFQLNLKDWEIELSDKQVEQFSVYGDFLREYNEKVNLTSLTEEKDIIEKHFLDSLSLLQLVNLRPALRVIDIGTGAGFPGVPLLIMEPNLNLTLLDSLQKRLVFLKELLAKLGLSAHLLHCRAEDGGRHAKYREAYDLATARAVAPLRVLLEYSLPYIRSGGHFLAMKGPSLTEELEEAKKALQILGAKAERDYSFNLPDSDSERRLLLVKKVRQTPKNYPRTPAQIKNKPL